MSDPGTTTRYCYHATRQEWKTKVCSVEGYEIYQRKYCCRTETTQASTSEVSVDYWLVQNQWGADWGDYGYIRIAKSDGEGVCGINMWVETLTLVPQA